MEVISVIPRSYCKGVVNAIRLAKEIRGKHPDQPITILGPLVHNRFVMEALQRINIQTLTSFGKSKIEMLDQIESGVVLFTAHGVSEHVKQAAKQKGLICYDATCEDVFATQRLIDQAITEGKRVLYIGKKNHPESMAVIENDPSVVLVTHIEEIPKNIPQPIFVTNQTTLSVLDIQPIFDTILTLYPDAEIAQEVCDATLRRQHAVIDIPKVDGIIVVGDPLSNNTRMLAKIAKDTHHGWVSMIESIEDLDVKLLSETSIIAVTAGASTPPALVEQVIRYCREFDPDNIQPVPKVDIDTLLI